MIFLIARFPKWHHLYPMANTLKHKIEQRMKLQGILSNIVWLFGDRILRMVIGLWVGVWLARYLGPEQFGHLNYSIALVTLFGTIAGLGLQDIVIRDLVKEPESVSQLLGTAFVVQFTGGVVAIMLIASFIIFRHPHDSLTKGIVSIISLTVIIKTTDVIKYWFEANVKSKYTVIIENGAFICIAITKLVLIIGHAPLIAFAWATLVEALIVAGGLLLLYELKVGYFRDWNLHKARALYLLRESWPLILSGVAIMVYMRVDQIMIGEMLGNQSVGIYTAAMRISEVWYFVPIAIMSSVFPSIIAAKDTGKDSYIDKLYTLYRLMFYLALTVCFLLTLVADIIIPSIYGSQYYEASSILKIHTWSGLFVAVGLVNGRWLLLENHLVTGTINTTLGALINIILNLILIPIYGIKGAALATLVSYGFASYFLLAVWKNTRDSFYAINKAIFFRGIR